MKNKPKIMKRSISIEFDPRNYVLLDGLILDFDQQKLLGYKDGEDRPLIGKSIFQFQRARANKVNKVLHSSMSANGEIYINSNHQLLSYNHVIAVDTNTKNVAGTPVSITAAFHFVPTSRNGTTVHGASSILSVFEVWEVVEKPENHGWWQVLKMITENISLFPGSIALVVDSDLGDHQAFNSREMPIFFDYYLPENVTIIYGSDKGGPEHLTTLLIRYCHNTADLVFENNNLVLDLKGLVPGVPGLYTYFRQWQDLSVFKKFAEP